MITLQYFNGKEWVFVSRWPNEATAWVSLGADNVNYRTVDESGKILADKSLKKETATIEYNGYQIKECTCFNGDGNPGFNIYEILPSGKWKSRRHSHCNEYTGTRSRDGHKLYTPFESMEQAIERAKNYIDNHIKPWAERLKELGRDK